MSSLPSASSRRILALEPDQGCGQRLRQLVADRLGAEIVVVASADAAISQMTSRVPDLILTSSLLPPQEEAQLQSHLKQLQEPGGPPVLIVPPVSDAPESAVPGSVLFFSTLRRRPKPVAPAYDISAIAARIEDALEQSRNERERRYARLFEDPWHLAEEGLSIRKSAADEKVRRYRAPRCEAANVPWLSGARTSYGLQVRIVNISGSGMLLEASNKIASGSDAEFHLFGPDTTIVIPSRVVRTEVAAVDGRGVKYLMAAAFDRNVDLARAGAGRAGSPRALAELLARVSSEIERGADAAAVRAAFEQELLKLVPVRDVKIRRVPAGSENNDESVYFTVSATETARTILQVAFNPDYELAAHEFTFLKASAAAAAIILLFERRLSTAAV
jgi:hypothetical protein